MTVYERVYFEGAVTGKDPVEIEPRPLVFEDVAAQATKLLGEVGGELTSVGEADKNQEFRLRVGDKLWIWRPLNTEHSDEDISHGFFVTPLEALTLFMAMGRYTDDKLNPGLEFESPEYERARRLINRLAEIVHKQFGSGS